MRPVAQILYLQHIADHTNLDLPQEDLQWTPS